MALQRLIVALLQVYSWLIIARVILSWVNPRPTNPFLLQIVRITEPVLAPLRRMLPPLGGLDFSPIVAFLLIHVLVRLIT